MGCMEAKVTLKSWAAGDDVCRCHSQLTYLINTQDVGLKSCIGGAANILTMEGSEEGGHGHILGLLRLVGHSVQRARGWVILKSTTNNRGLP
jgi:hypothetical protein